MYSETPGSSNAFDHTKRYLTHVIRKVCLFANLNQHDSADKSAIVQSDQHYRYVDWVYLNQTARMRSTNSRCSHKHDPISF